MDLEHLLISVYCLIDEWRKAKQTFPPPRVGRPARLSNAEVLTLAVLAQWPRWRSERDFWRFADAHLRTYFPQLLTQSQLNRRFRALEQELRELQLDLAETLTDGSEVYWVLDTTLIPAVVRVRASRKGLFAGQAAFGRCVSKTEWVYGFKVALAVDPEGVITAFGLAPANCDERPIGEFLISSDAHDTYLADKGFSLVEWERHWLEQYGAGRGHPTGERLAGLVGGRSPMGSWKEAADRGRHFTTEGPIRPGTSPRQDPERALE